MFISADVFGVDVGIGFDVAVAVDRRESITFTASLITPVLRSPVERDESGFGMRGVHKPWKT